MKHILLPLSPLALLGTVIQGQGGLPARHLIRLRTVSSPAAVADSGGGHCRLNFRPSNPTFQPRRGIPEGGSPMRWNSSRPNWRKAMPSWIAHRTSLEHERGRLSWRPLLIADAPRPGPRVSVLGLTQFYSPINVLNGARALACLGPSGLI
jgi:hypothetical protein